MGGTGEEPRILDGPRFKAVACDIRNLRVNVSRLGDVAWWSAILDDLAEWDGRPAGWKDTRWTGVLEKRDGAWVIVQMHFSFAADRVKTEALAGAKKSGRLPWTSRRTARALLTAIADDRVPGPVRLFLVIRADPLRQAGGSARTSPVMSAEGTFLPSRSKPRIGYTAAPSRRAASRSRRSLVQSRSRDAYAEARR